MSKSNTKDTLLEGTDRRQYLAALSAGAGAALAGCLGDDDDDTDPGDGDGEMGERVPELTFSYLSAIGRSEELEDITVQITGDIEETLGVDLSVEGIEITTHYSNVWSDARETNMWIDGFTPTPDQLDPHNLLIQATLLHAGNNGRTVWSHWANCEYTELVLEQQAESDPDRRDELIHEALTIQSEAVERIPLDTWLIRTAVRTDEIQIPDGGDLGTHPLNFDLIRDIELTNADVCRLETRESALENKDYILLNSLTGRMIFAEMINYPLVRWNTDQEIVGALAEDWDIEDDAQRFTFYLREDATFHNGDPVLAEDVVWTYEWMEENTDVLTEVSPMNYESVTAVDDHTVEIVLPESFAPFLAEHAGVWGIHHSDLWIEGGAEENPEDVDWGLIGAGPYEVENYQRGEFLELTPNEDFWDTPESPLRWEAYADSQSAQREFEDGNLHFFEPSGGVANEIEETMSDVAEVHTIQSWNDQFLATYCNHGPTKFREFRMALSQSIDRQLVSEVGAYGESEPHLYASVFNSNHPNYPDDPDEHLTKIAETASSNPEVAQEVLEQEGWSWDDDGNLRYPPDADLEPTYPPDSEPMDHPDLFPCVEDIEEF